MSKEHVDGPSELVEDGRLAERGGLGARRARATDQRGREAHPDPSPSLTTPVLDEETSERLRKAFGMTEPKAPRRKAPGHVDTLRDED